MSFGKRRTRSTRAQLRPARPIDSQQGLIARRRDRLARAAVLGVAVLCTAALVNGSGPPFTYRLGQRPSRELRVNVEKFERRNQMRANTERQMEADKVPPAMVNDPSPIRDLADQLEDFVDAVAAADSLDSLPPAVQQAWKPTEVSFRLIKDALAKPGAREGLTGRLARAFAPAVRDGVLGPEALPRTEEASRTLSIRDAGAAAGPPRPVPRERVGPERMARLDGPLAREFAAAFDDPALGHALFGLVAPRFAGIPTLTFDGPLTEQLREAARNSVRDVYDIYRRGDVLVEQDQEIGEEQIILLRMEHDKAVSEMPPWAILRRAGSAVVMVASLFALVGYYVHRNEPAVDRDLGRVASACGLVVLAMALVRLLATQTWDAELVPVALSGMIVAVAYNPHFAMMITFALCVMTNLAMGSGIGHFMVLMGGTVAGVLTLNEVRTRTKLIKVGATSALGYFILTWATGLWQNQPTPLLVQDSLWRAGWGLMGGFFLGGSLPFIEGAFGIVTGISLLELGDITHPLLQELVRRAPGTHNHSVTVATIAEAAAERIGANALLIRIGAYFHDIGKMLKPHYFIENQTGMANRHANLAPAMSTLIIIGHVKDGADLARQHHLPQSIIDLIEQHHGTTLVEYFYREATRRSECDPDAADVLEGLFRYPGPRPQSKEAGILMVADAVESASRTLSEPTPSRIEGLVSEMIDKRLRDGQFDECGLTLREIAEIRDSLIKSLIGIYHGRVKYPQQRTA
ncbi:HDIG domain-containing protein [Isosphaeraceae bacterium EP7]